MKICRYCSKEGLLTVEDAQDCGACTKGDFADIGSTIFVINEENHGNVIFASTRRKAIQALIDTAWIAGYCELWDYETQKGTPINQLHKDWEEWLLTAATDLDFENMGFSIHEEKFFK